MPTDRVEPGEVGPRMNKENVRVAKVLASDTFSRTDHLHVAHLMAAAIRCMVDRGTGIDSGCDGESADLWFKVGGVEYYANIRRSGAQKAKDRETPHENR